MLTPERQINHKLQLYIFFIGIRSQTGTKSNMTKRLYNSCRDLNITLPGFHILDLRTTRFISTSGQKMSSKNGGDWRIDHILLSGSTGFSDHEGWLEDGPVADGNLVNPFLDHFYRSPANLICWLMNSG